MGKEPDDDNKNINDDENLHEDEHMHADDNVEQDVSVSNDKVKDVKPEYEDLDFIDDSRRAILNESGGWSNVLLYSIVLFLIIAVIWAKFAVLDEITRAEGKVIPSSQVQVIQNLEGGILSEILVSEGDVVEKDQVLLRIDDTRFSSSFRENRSKYLSLLAAVARLRAEATGKKKVAFPEIVKREAPDLLANEQHLFDSQYEQLESSLKTLRGNYLLAEEELAITRPLVKEGLMSKLELLRLQREVNELKGKIDAETDNFRSHAQEELNTKEAELTSLSEALMAMEDRVVRATVRSPVHGTVKKVNIATIGGVIQPGKDIMEIVPLEDTLLVEARVRPSDIAFIHPGQEAVVKVTAYDYAIYGGLDGVVEYISADTIKEDENGEEEYYYKILVRTDTNHLGSNEKPLPIIPGMIVSVDILTGKKSVLDYLLKPILRAKYRALSER